MFRKCRASYFLSAGDRTRVCFHEWPSFSKTIPSKLLHPSHSLAPNIMKVTHPTHTIQGYDKKAQTTSKEEEKVVQSPNQGRWNRFHATSLITINSIRDSLYQHPPERWTHHARTRAVPVDIQSSRYRVLLARQAPRLPSQRGSRHQRAPQVWLFMVACGCLVGR